jgi:hypothetical protein
MPKLLTYRRPAPVSKLSWNHTPESKANLPRKAPAQPKPVTLPAITLPPLEQLLGKK